MAQEVSVAPKERINIVYKPATGDAQAEIELPLKLVFMGDFRLRPDSRPLEDRRTIPVDKNNFDQVMEGQELVINLDVPNLLSGNENERLPVTVRFKSLEDFKPEKVVDQVPELKKLLELRGALTALKSPLVNKPEFRRRLQSIIDDEALREKLIKELGIEEA